MSWTYGYDSLDRLTNATSTPRTDNWTYDADGNRLTESGSVSGTPYSSTYSVSGTKNQLSSVTGSRANTYSYDLAGNVTGETNAGRPIALTGTTTVSYVYNALSQRVWKSGPASPTYFVYDKAGHLLGEYGVGGTLIQETVWMGDLPVATLRPKVGGGVDIFYVHTDHLGTPRKVTRPADNALVWRWDPAAFGTGVPNENPQGAGSFQYNLRFAGQYDDAESGLSYNHARDYDPATGRYIESDPIGLEGGINTYGYVGAQPTGYIDPFGLAKCSVVFVNGAGTLHCVPDDPSHSPVTIPVSSGNNGGGQACKNNPACQAAVGRGPIPSGCWQWTQGKTSKPNGRVLQECPGWPATGRTDIRTHSCANPFGPSKRPPFCSEGCVTGTAPDIKLLNRLIDAEPNSTVYVTTQLPAPFLKELPGSQGPGNLFGRRPIQ